MSPGEIEPEPEIGPEIERETETEAKAGIEPEADPEATFDRKDDSESGSEAEAMSWGKDSAESDAEPKMTSLMRWTIAVLGLFGRVLLPVGLFSVVAVGLHLGCDGLDDVIFAGINFLDAEMDHGLVAAIQWIWSLFGASAASVESATYRAVDFIDVGVKHALAGGAALVWELSADALIAVPALLFRHERVAVGGLALRALKDPTLLRFFGPPVVMMACVAGAIAVASEVETFVFAFGHDASLSASQAEVSARIVSIVALIVVFARLSTRLLRGVLEWADGLSERDRIRGVSVVARRVRGMVTILVALPASTLAFGRAIELLPGFWAGVLG